MSSNISKLKIAISGKSGCGNTTVSRIIAEVLGLRLINFTFRSLAQERGLDLAEVLKKAALDDSWDREVDSRQVAMAREDSGCVLGSRLAIWMLPEANLKVFLTASPLVRAGRIQNREGGNLEKIAEFTASRDKQDSERYMRIYNIDNNDFAFADLIIQTDKMNPTQIVDTVLRRVNEL